MRYFLSNEKTLVVPSGCLSARAVVHPPPIGISCFFCSHAGRVLLPDCSATQWTASVHTLHMPKPVITFVFKALRYGLLDKPGLETSGSHAVLSLEAHGTHWLVSCGLWKFERRPFLALPVNKRRFARPPPSETLLFRLNRGCNTIQFCGDCNKR